MIPRTVRRRVAAFPAAYPRGRPAAPRKYPRGASPRPRLRKVRRPRGNGEARAGETTDPEWRRRYAAQKGATEKQLAFVANGRPIAQHTKLADLRRAEDFVPPPEDLGLRDYDAARSPASRRRKSFSFDEQVAGAAAVIGHASARAEAGARAASSARGRDPTRRALGRGRGASPR